MAEKESWNLEQIMYESIDKIKYLISPELWANDLLNCTKNEIFILFLLYRSDDVNMSQIAEYIGVPLNTATGIVARMEKKGLITRLRSEKDKRVVTLQMTASGNEQIQSCLSKFLHYGNLIFDRFTPEEVQMTFRILDKVMDVLGEEHDRELEEKKETKIRRISIE